MAKRKPRIEQAEIVHVFGSRLREVRQSRGMTQAELAEVLGVSRRSIIRWEHDTTEPHPGRMAFITQLLTQADLAA